MRTSWGELLCDYLKQLSSKALQKSLFNNKGSQVGAQVYFPCQALKKLILSAGAGALELSGFLVEALWSHPE